MIINWNAIRQRDLRFLLVDVTMTSVALLNLLLIAFDMSYLTLRNTYVRHLPQVASRYDLLKGIEPHRFTAGYVQRAEALFRDYPGLDAASQRARQTEMVALSAQMIEEDPFARAFKSGDLERIKDAVRHQTGVESSSKLAFKAFWEFDSGQYLDRVTFFRSKIEPLMATNYWRRIGTTGRFVDDFYYVDLLFTVIFLTEFVIRWAIAVRRHGPDQRVLYPLFRWYDLVGSLPFPELRFLRLFRIFAIYQRLVRSKILTLGDSAILRLFRRYKAIITEELSDQVAVQILSDIQEKVRLGSGRDVLEQTLLPHKDDIADAIVGSIHSLENRLLAERQSEWVQLLTNVLEDALQGSPEMAQVRKIPILNRRVAQMTSRANLEAMVAGNFQRTVKSLESHLRSPSGRAFVESLVEDVLDEAIHLSKDALFQDLLQRINVQLLDEFKRGNSTVKKWKSGQTGPLPRLLPSAPPAP